MAAAPILAAHGKVRDAIARVRSVEGITTAGAFAIAFMVSRWLPIVVVFYVAALVGYYFHIIRFVGQGHGGLPGPSDAVDSWSETLGIFLQGVLCVVVGQLPIVVYFLVRHDLPDAPLLVALAVIGQLYMPAALLATALSNQALAAAWPPVWIAIIARSPRRYAEFAGLWLASIVVWIGLYASTSWLVDGSLSLTGTDRPLQWLGFGALVASFVWNLFAFTQAALVGVFLRENRDELGYTM